MGEREAVNIHAMGESFVGVVRDAKFTAEVQSEEREQGEVVEFQAQVKGHGVSEKVKTVEK